MHDEDDQVLIAEIVQSLELDHQYVRDLEGWNEEPVAQIRRCGRAAGRLLKYRVRTFASDPAERGDGRSVVWVVITAFIPAEETRIRERADLLIRETLG
jgi:hypothetical protein